MEQSLIEAMNQYFHAGGCLDLEVLDRLYADDFQNVRLDRDGRTITFTKAEFMARFREMKTEGSGHEPSHASHSSRQMCMTITGRC